MAGRKKTNPLYWYALYAAIGYFVYTKWFARPTIQVIPPQQ
jgi:hypothetical protein